MDPEDKRFLTALHALVNIAKANFPEDCIITVAANGKQNAQVSISAYTLEHLLITLPD